MYAAAYRTFGVEARRPSVDAGPWCKITGGALNGLSGVGHVGHVDDIVSLTGAAYMNRPAVISKLDDFCAPDVCVVRYGYLRRSSKLPPTLSVSRALRSPHRNDKAKIRPKCRTELWAAYVDMARMIVSSRGLFTAVLVVSRAASR